MEKKQIASAATEAIEIESYSICSSVEQQYKDSETFAENQEACKRFFPETTDSTVTSTTEIWDLILSNLQKVDFVKWVYPGVEELRCKYDSTQDPKEREELEVQMKHLRVSKNQKLVVVCEEILRVSELMDYGLAKRGAYVYVYNSNYWSSIDNEELQSFLGNAAEKMGIMPYESRQYSFRDMLSKQFMETSYLKKLPTNGRVSINLLNGTFDVTDKGEMKLRSFDRQDFLTYQLVFNFDKDAEAPIFKNFLNEILPDPDSQKILAEFLGYVFTKNLKLEKALILYGTGANGKSVIFDIIMALLGSDNVSSYSMTDLCNDNGYHRAMIEHKLLNWPSEIGGKTVSDTFKKLASGEPISARLPYGEPYIIDSYAKMAFNANVLPKEVEQTNAFFRRFLIIPFSVTIPEERQDKELSKRIIESELAGVFNWVLDGLKRLLAQRAFSQCDAVERELSLYRKESDTVQLFLEDENYKQVNEFKIPLKDLYSEFRSFCNTNGYMAVANKEFARRLRSIGFILDRQSQGNMVNAEKKYSLDVQFLHNLHS